MNITTIALLVGAGYLFMQHQGAAAPAGGGSATVNSGLGGTGGSTPMGGYAPSTTGGAGLDGLLASLGSLVSNITKPGTAPTSAGQVVTGATNNYAPDLRTPLPPAPVYNDSHVTAVASSGTTLQDLYANVLHRAPDAGGLAFWESQFGGDVVTQDQRAAWMAAALPELSAS